MYIIVVGGGRLGYYLTKALLDQGHEVLIIEKNSLVCETINDELGGVCIQGDGCEITILAEAGTDRADMLIAVTGEDADNLVACQAAKHRFNVSRTISRIRNPQNETIFKKLGVDVTVNTTSIILEHLEEEVPTHPLTHLMTIQGKGLEIVEIKVPPDSKTVGRRVRELPLPPDSIISLIIRKDQKPLIPTEDSVIQAEDQIIAVTNAKSEEALRAVMSELQI